MISIKFIEQKIKNARSRFRSLYYYNEDLFHLANERYKKRVSSNQRSIRSKIINFIVNSYGEKMFRRLYGYPYYNRDNENKLVVDPLFVDLISYEKEFSEKLSQAEVVSFDIFDTLLVRKVSLPTDVFRILEATDSNFDGFYQERVLAEKRARNIFGSEVTLDQIYEVISPKFKTLVNMELELEKKVLYRNDSIYKLYKKALSEGKKIIAISDMYLPKTFLKSILVEAGYKEISDIFISGELKKSKCENGELFSYVSTELHVNLSSILHLGDNVHSDYVMPKNKGCNAVRIPTLQQLFEYNPTRRFLISENGSIARSIHNSIVKKYNNSNKSYFQKIGYMLGGPLALGYLTWLDKEISKSRADCVLFVARDGWLLHKLFNYYFNKNQIHTGYVYLNRLLGLKGFATYLDEPHYLKVLLDRAHREIGIPASMNKFKEDVKIFNDNFDAIEAWGRDLRKNLVNHGTSEAKNSKRIVTVDMGTGRFASLRFAKKIFGERLINSYFFLTVNDYHDRLRYQSYLQTMATSRDILVNSDKLNGDINIMEIMEILISSPEPRVIGVDEKGPVFDGNNDRKDYYYDIAKGIESYVQDFFDSFSPNSHTTFKAIDWMEYAKEFITNLNDIDLNELSVVTFSPSADNQSEAHKPFVRK